MQPTDLEYVARCTRLICSQLDISRDHWGHIDAEQIIPDTDIRCLYIAVEDPTRLAYIDARKASDNDWGKGEYWENRKYGTFSRVGKLLYRVLKNPDQDLIELIANGLKRSEIELLYTGDNDATITDIYRLDVADNAGTLANSCMRRGSSDPEWFEIYDDLQAHGKLEILYALDGEDLKGRALVWKVDGESALYLDRQYGPESFIAAARAWATANGATQREGNGHSYEGRLGLAGYHMEVDLPQSITDYYHLPYMDTFKHSDGDMLTTHASIYNLEHTDGRPVTPCMECDECGAMIDEDSGDYLRRDYNTYCTDCAVETVDGDVELYSDCVELANGGHLARGSAAFVDRYNGYFHEDECTETENGEWEIADEVEEDEVSGFYHHEDDMTTDWRGRRVLEEDTTTTEHGAIVHTDDPYLVPTDYGDFLRSDPEIVWCNGYHHLKELDLQEVPKPQRYYFAGVLKK